MPDRHPTAQRTDSPGKAGVRPKQLEKGKQQQQWHAVAIVITGHACEAANLLKGHRFLSKEAPKLPLECCPSPEYCRCTYRHFTDRRGGPRRGADRGEQITRRPTIGERRASRGRRTDDIEDE